MAVVSLYDKGFSIRRGGIAFRERKGGGRRGLLTGKYSSASFRRLREFVITHECSGECWGITLTVPGLDNLTAVQFRVLHHKFVNWANMRKLPLVWRVELQQRGMPHLHCVLYGSVMHCLACASEWFRVLRTCTVFSLEKVAHNSTELVELPRAYVAGASHAFNMVRLDGGFSAFRYLVAHMSKGKREQLGYAGRNWGVVHRSAFSEVRPVFWELDETMYYSILRWVRRWTRRRVLVSSGCSFWVSNPAILSRMLSFVNKRLRGEGGGEADVVAEKTRGVSEYWFYSWFGLQWVQAIDFLTFDLVRVDTVESCYYVMAEIVQFFSMYSDNERVPF